MKLRTHVPDIIMPIATLPTLLLGLWPLTAAAQTSFLAPDGKNRFPAVTIFCPSGNTVAPCSFGSGSGSSGGGGLTVGGQPISGTNRLPTTDAVLDGLVSGGALGITGTVALSGTPTVTLGTGTSSVGGVSQAGAWTVALAGGNNAIGSVSVSNLPATQAVTGTVGLSAGTAIAIANLPAVQTISGSVGEAGNWSVGLTAGSNQIGTVAVTNFPANQPVSGAVSQSGGWTVGLAAGSNPIGSVAVTNLPATQPISGAVSVSNLPTTQPVSGAVSVSNLPATQAVSAATLPLPAGAATSAGQSVSLASVAPAAATATNAMLIGCQANTTLPSFTAGQQGAVPCDTSGRPYVVTVPSANNVPGYLQAVSTGGASIYRAINAASSAMGAGVKASSGMVYGYEACNTGNSGAYLRLFALAGAPTVGTSTPAISKLLSPGTCQNFETPIGLVFAGGIAMDTTAGSIADSDTTVIATASQVSVEIYYK